MTSAGTGEESLRSSTLWASSEAYQPYVGRWSLLVAEAFLSWLNLPPRGTWLDVGCGTGALSSAILRDSDPQMVTGVDPSTSFLDYARHHMADNRAQFEIGNAMDLPYTSDWFDAAVSGLMLNFVPDPAKAVAEMTRVVRPGGTVALYVWDYSGKMEMMRYFWDAAAELDPAAQPLVEATRFPMCQPEPLENLLRSAGLTNVESTAVDIPTRFKDFDDYWLPFLGGHAPAPAYALSLDETRRTALRDRIRAELPVGPDGSIDIIARAWAVRGRRSPVGA